MSFKTGEIAKLILSVLPEAGSMIRGEIAQFNPRTLTLQQYRVLALVHGGVCFSGDLSLNLGVSPAAMSKTIDNLENLGWVDKRHCPEDGRKFIVEMTPLGIKTFDSFLTQLGARLQSRINRMDAKKRNELGRGLQALSCLLRQDE